MAVEAKLKGEEVEEKVVEEKAVVGGQWLRVFFGSRNAGAIQDLPWDPAILAGPHRPNLDHPLLVPPEGLVWALRFFMQRVHPGLLGQGRWVWVDEGGVVHLDKPGRKWGGDAQIGGEDV